MIYKASCLKPVKNDWCYKWYPMSDKIVNEGVKGPFTHPVVAVPFPLTFQDDDLCDCAEEARKCYSRNGIPNPWNEYLLVNEGTRKGSLHPDEFPKKDVKITKCLRENYAVDFGQGIPDPWKKWITLEPTKETDVKNLKSDLEKYFGYLKNGSRIYETERICCPNCNRQLLVFCFSKFGGRRKIRKGKKEEEKIVKVENSTDGSAVDDNIEENNAAEMLHSKDACVETDEWKGDVQTVEKCREYRSCDCPRLHRSRCECHPISREVKPKLCKCKENDDSSDGSCSCSLCRNSYRRLNDFHTPICVHNYLPFLPRLPTNEQVRWGSFSGQGYQNIPNEASTSGKDQQHYQPGLPSPHLIPNPSLSLPLPQFPTQPEHCHWFSPGFFSHGNTKGHFFELKWVCPKCDKTKKKKWKAKHKSGERISPIRRKCTRCLCGESKQKGRFARFEENDSDSDSCGIYKISRVRNREYEKRESSERPRCRCEEGTSYSGSFKTKGIPQGRRSDRDFMELLQMLGCTDLYRNKSNTGCNEPMVNLNWAKNPSNDVSTSRRATHASYPKRNFKVNMN